MEEFDFLRKVCIAVNSDNHEELASLILTNEMALYPRCQGAAMLGFELTKENMKNHIDAARKLASFAPHESWGFTEDYRHSLLKELLLECN